MAESELEIIFKWENNVSFEMTTKRDAGDISTVVQLDENGHIKELWPSVQSICQTFFSKELKTIGDEMKGK